MRDYSVARNLELYRYVDQAVTLSELQAHFISRLQLGLPNIEFMIGPPGAGKTTVQKEVEHSRKGNDIARQFPVTRIIHGEVIDQLDFTAAKGGLGEETKYTLTQYQTQLLEGAMQDSSYNSQIIQVQMPAGVSKGNLLDADQQDFPEHRGEALIGQVAGFDEKDINAIFIGVVPTARVRYRAMQTRMRLDEVIKKHNSDPTKIKQIFVEMGWDEKTLPSTDTEEGSAELVSMATHCANPLALKAVYTELAELAKNLEAQKKIRLPDGRTVITTEVDEIVSTLFLPEEEPDPNDEDNYDTGTHLIAMTLDYVLKERFGIKPEQRVIVVNRNVDKIEYPHDKIHEKKNKKK